MKIQKNKIRGSLQPVPEELKQELPKFEDLMERQKQEIEALCIALSLKREQAMQLLFANEEMGNYLAYAKRLLDLDLVKVMKNLQDEINKKTNRGSLEQVQKGAIALGVLRDKVFGSSDKPGFQMTAGNINVTLGWHFKPYKQRELVKEE